MVNAAVVARVDRLEPVVFAAQGFRHYSPGRDPLSGEGARILGGRWNPENSFSTLYLGLSRGVVLAEFARMAAKQGRDINDFLPRTLSTYDISLASVLDIRDAAARSTIELPDEDIFIDSHAATREIGEAAHYLGFEAVLAPSVTRAGDVLAIFPDRFQPASLVEVTGSEPLTATTS